MNNCNPRGNASLVGKIRDTQRRRLSGIACAIESARRKATEETLRNKRLMREIRKGIACEKDGRFGEIE